ncbi:glycosyltransferase family 2 protein [Fictibacillus halophilus]|uniref:glycosyltransferase family 2 protein n=1 Tax=Fictibacillus halophilus TaxID=1610490 RepID=UPI001CFAE61D|nr:glycosyltransferase family A protein [Fictibacillus halophilus]
MNAPLVSVVIPSYNPGKLLESAVRSIENQTYKNIEIIIVDDGSTDGTREWLKQNSSRLKFFFQDNSGASKARNKGVSLSSGEYIAFLDADDIWLPSKLEQQVELLQHNNISFVFTNGFIVNGDVDYEDIINNISNNEYNQIFDTYVRPPRLVDFTSNFRVHSVPTSSILVEKSLFKEVNGFPNLVQGEDFVLLQLLLSLKPAISISNPLMIYRVHSSNTSSSLKNSTLSKRLGKILNKDMARIKLSNELSRLKQKKPTIINIYRSMPLFIRLILLLLWRIKFGANHSKVKKDLLKYLTGKG